MATVVYKATLFSSTKLIYNFIRKKGADVFRNKWKIDMVEKIQIALVNAFKISNAPNANQDTSKF